MSGLENIEPDRLYCLTDSYIDYGDDLVSFKMNFFDVGFGRVAA